MVRRKTSRKKINSVVTATGVSIPTCKLRLVTVVNDNGTLCACADKNYAARTMVAVYWNLDSACTIHKTPHSEFFDKYQVIPIGQHHVTVMNRYRMSADGVRTVHLLIGIAIPNAEKKDLKGVVLHGVLHTPVSQESLILVSCLIERGKNVRCDGVGAVIIGQNGVERKAKRVDRMYVIIQWDDYSAHVVTTSDIHVLHRRLDNTDHDMIAALHKDTTGISQVKKVIDQKRYVDCLLGKMKIHSFSRKLGQKGTQPFVIVYVDLC